MHRQPRVSARRRANAPRWFVVNVPIRTHLWRKRTCAQRSACNLAWGQSPEEGVAFCQLSSFFPFLLGNQ